MFRSKYEGNFMCEMYKKSLSNLREVLNGANIQTRVFSIRKYLKIISSSDLLNIISLISFFNSINTV